MRPILASLAVGLLMAGTASADVVPLPGSLDDQAHAADLVCKATVIGDRVVTDPWFAPATGFEVRETELRVVSAIKGAPGATLRFRHYARDAGDAVGMYTPAHIELVAGKSYLVIAMRAGAGYRQPIQHGSLDILAAADARPHHGVTLHDAAWHELTTALGGAPADAVRAIDWLDQLSGGGVSARTDFTRADVIAALRPFAAAQDVAVATAAIGVLGGDSPYLDDRQAEYWLAGLGTGSIPGIAARPPTGAPDHATASALLAAATRGPAATRALAIRALGHASVPPALLAAWVRDPDPAVRAAAVAISAETADRAAILAGLSDRAPAVRAAAALAIAFARDATLAPRLGALLVDPARPVRTAAALALLAFPTAQVAGVMTANLGTQYRALFVNALARRDARPHLAELAEVITKQLKPDDWWGGFVPAGDAWNLLFGYVAGRPAGELTRGSLDGSLAALERMQWFSSSEPCYLYALYLRRGMPARAAAFRAAMRTAPAAAGLTLETYFAEVDKHPDNFAHDP